MIEYLQDLTRYRTLDASGVAVLCDAVAEQGVVPSREFQFVTITRSPVPDGVWLAVFRHEPTKLDFCLVPAGEFLMGSPLSEQDRGTDEAQHAVRLSLPFLVSRTPCTQDAWTRVSGGSNPSSHTGDPRLPVECVSFDECERWCRAAGFALPSESQWEYVCRAGTSTPYWTGVSALSLEAAGWFGANSQGRSHPVGEKLANGFAIHDVHGNVAEWCSGWYADAQSPTSVDPASPSVGEYRVFRGGSWGDAARHCRAAYRCALDPGVASETTGFRPIRVCDLT